MGQGVFTGTMRGRQFSHYSVGTNQTKKSGVTLKGKQDSRAYQGARKTQDAVRGLNHIVPTIRFYLIYLIQKSYIWHKC